MRILGAILAGGQARRFGSDKAHAFYQGERLVDLVSARLASQCDKIVMCGREEPGFACLQDVPEVGLGPLGGLNAALAHAGANGYGAVLSAACDIPNLPLDLAQSLVGDGAAIAQNQPVVGFWPVALAENLDRYLSQGGRKLFDFADLVGARQVRFDPPLLNINRPEDLA